MHLQIRQRNQLQLQCKAYGAKLSNASRLVRVMNTEIPSKTISKSVSKPLSKSPTRSAKKHSIRQLQEQSRILLEKNQQTHRQHMHLQIRQRNQLQTIHLQEKLITKLTLNLFFKIIISVKKNYDISENTNFWYSRITNLSIV